MTMWPFKSQFVEPKKDPEPARQRSSVFSTDHDSIGWIADRSSRLARAIASSFQKPLPVAATGEDGAAVAMDDGQITRAKALTANFQQGIPDAQFGWYASQGFIGYQVCAMIAQNWLVDKCLTIPAEDAVRKGYEITVNDGTEVAPELIDKIRDADKRFRINEQMTELVRMSRMFGIRVAFFDVTSADKDYYEKPFNPDGVTKGSYKGIVQVDPYWITPELDIASASNPASRHFYEATYWRINGKRYHRSHLIVAIPFPVADVLKPSYIYGGISIPQKIAERVYAAERTANEAPQLALSKRSTVMKTDLSEFLADQVAAEARLQTWAYFRDNFGVKVIDKEADEIQQFDTTLSELDSVIMTQYQLVAAAANVPATKLLGTSPKGFNATGEFEESSYHESLESIQTHHLTPMLDRHHLLVIRSEVAPDKPFATSVNWKPLDSPTEKEVAEINEIKARTGKALIEAGAIDGIDERARITSDPQSGYSGLPEPVGEERTDDEDPTDGAA